MPFAVTATPMLKLVKSLSCSETLCNKAVYYFFYLKFFGGLFLFIMNFFRLK